MSTASIKSGSSLTPIEDIEVDTSDLLNSSKYPFLNEKDRNDETQKETFVEEDTELKHEEMSKYREDKYVHDILSLEESGTYFRSGAQSPESVNEDQDQLRESLSQSMKNGNGSKVESSSVVMVRESPSEKILDTVDETNPVITNVDDDYSMSEFNDQSDEERSMNESSYADINPTDSPNRLNMQSRNDLSNIEEENVSQEGDDDISHQSQSENNQSIRSSANSNIRNVENSSGMMGHHSRDSPAESHPSDHYPSANSDGKQNNPEQSEETDASRSNDYLDRTDSVEISYFASFKSSQSQRKESRENSYKERTDPVAVTKSSKEVDLTESSMRNPSMVNSNGDQNEDKIIDDKPLNEQEEDGNTSNFETQITMKDENVSMSDTQAESDIYKAVEISNHQSKRKYVSGEGVDIGLKEKEYHENNDSSELTYGNMVLSMEETEIKSHNGVSHVEQLKDGEEGSSSVRFKSPHELHSKTQDLLIHNDEIDVKPNGCHEKAVPTRVGVSDEDMDNVHKQSLHNDNGDTDKIQEFFSHLPNSKADNYQDQFAHISGTNRDETNYNEDNSMNKDNYDTGPENVTKISYSDLDDKKIYIYNSEDTLVAEVTKETSTSPTKTHTSCVDNEEVNKIINDSFYVEEDEIRNQSHDNPRSDPKVENDSRGPRTATSLPGEGDKANTNYEGEESAKDVPFPDSLQEPIEQDIERGAPPDEDSNINNDDEDVVSNTPIDSTGRTSSMSKESEDSEFISETQEESERTRESDAATIRVTKSSSTLSVKTISSSSSKISNSTRRLKDDNKNLERLLKGPYAEKPTTPSSKTRQKSAAVSKKKSGKSQDKSKSKTGVTDNKSLTNKLLVHKSKNKAGEKSRSPRGKSNSTAIKSASHERNASKNSPETHQESIERAENSLNKDSTSVVYQRNISHIEETEMETDVKQQNISTEPSTEILPRSEFAPQQREEKESSHEDSSSVHNENQKEMPSFEKMETNSAGIDSPVVHRSDSLSMKSFGNKEKNIPAISEKGKTVSSGTGNKNTAENKSLRQSLLNGKRKIIISSPKTSEKLSAKEAKNATHLKINGTTNGTSVTKDNAQKNSSLESNSPIMNKNGAKKATANVENGDSGLKPTTITIIDETTDSPKTNPPAGRIIINNIKMNLKKKSMQKNANSASKTSKRQSRSPSPEGNTLSNSGRQKEGKAAYKTQSMSSLQVPGHLAATNTWDPPKEEDATSIYSRRPSMDSVSRKSVDYRIRNTATVIQPQAEEKPKSVFNNDETFIQNAVPCLPLGLAIACLLLNTVLPGSGTALSGVSILCCGHSRLSNKEDQVLNTMCANLIVGLAQLLTVSFLLVGWFWSIAWGIKMVSLSVKRRQEIKQQREKDLQTLALSAFGSPKRLSGFGV